VILLDTSTSVEKEFYAEKNFALDLIKMMPEDEFSVSDKPIDKQTHKTQL
jgi:hypothetical protein